TGLVAVGLANGVTPVLNFDHFYNHAELTRALQTLAEAYPQFVTLKSIGKSHQGRDIWAVILNNRKTGPAEHKPGYYIDGNIHGNEIQGAEVALYAVWYLLTNYGKGELATRLLNERSFYVVPTMNPDSRDYYIGQAADPNSPRSGLVPYDNDRDGVKDEDGPDDLDGDGSITQMRRKSPTGRMKPHPDDPRIMVQIRPGEKGEYETLGSEGIDNDGDGSINEDGPGGYDMNRNFAYNWQPNYVQSGSGDFPFCFPETRAIRDFLLANPNIAGAQSFHNSGGLILRGPGAKNLGEPPATDVRVYDFIGKKGEKMIPGYRYITVYKDMYTVYGGSLDFIYCTLGIFTFSNELDTDYATGTGYTQRGAQRDQREDEDLAYLRGLQRRLDEMVYHDNVLLGDFYADWKPYKHPLYGDIEIGGIKKFGSRVPPPFKLAETCHRNAAFCMFHADQLPRLSFSEPKITKLDGGLYQMDLSIENSRVTPTVAGIARQKKLHRLDRLVIEGEKTKLVAAGQLTDKDRGLTRQLKTRENVLWMDGGTPGFGQSEVRLLLRGKGDIKLVYDSLKGGQIEKKVKLP
ncbi:MAG: peptidase M14, partial [Acidobacteria bacterium]